jgi:tRNA threonylcarbamoyladenosine biosynthesis protein TsaB
MNILAINTADGSCSVTLKTLHQFFSKTEVALQLQAELLLSFIDELLTEAGLSLSELQAIAFSAGPASFTSLRLALSAAQGLALPFDLKIIPVCSLQALAYAVYLQNSMPECAGMTTLKIIVCTNAYMGQVFFGAFEINPEGDCSIIHEASLMNPTDLPPLTGEAWQGIGNGFVVYKEALQPFIDRYIPYLQSDFKPEAAMAVADLALKAINSSSISIDPVYLRSASAWKKVK